MKEQCTAKLTLLRNQGHELRRPAAENLGGGIYELRAKANGVNYRMLYFFHGNVAAVVSHGIVKEQKFPPREIDLAVKRKRMFEQAPKRHTYEEPS